MRKFICRILLKISYGCAEAVLGLAPKTKDEFYFDNLMFELRASANALIRELRR